MSFFDKKKKIFIAAIVYIIMTFCIIFVEKKFYHNAFCIDRAIIYFLGQIFVICNIIFDYKKIWRYIFKHRYMIGICLFIIMVAAGYSTSSIGQYDYVIQPHHTQKYNLPIWGTVRGIRSDEFIASIPPLLSQKLIGTFASINDKIMGVKGSVLLFPKVTTLNISVLSSPQLLGFLFLDETRGFSFYSLLNYFLAFYGALEMLLILLDAKNDNERNIFLNKKFLAFVGTLLLVFNPLILWWNCQTFLAYGSLCIVFLYKLLYSKNLKHKLLFSVLLGIFGSCFVGIAYPAWQVPFGYVYLGLIIYIFIKNWKKIDKKNLLYLIISISLVGLILIPAFLGSQEEMKLISNTVYPGARMSLGGDAWEFLFLWFQSGIYGIYNVGNPCEFSQFISLYPIPLLLGISEIILNRKSRKKDIYLIILVTLTIILNIWNFIPIGFLAKLTLLYMSTTQRAQVVIGLLNILIMLRLIQKYSTNKFNYKRLISGLILAFVTVVIAVYSSNKLTPGYLTSLKTSILTMGFFCLIVMLVLNYKKTNVILLIILSSISLFCLATTFPIQRGLSVINDKPLSKEIRKISIEDKNATWISANTSLYMANFALANGARVINSVNFYPNLKLWQRIDADRKYEDIYNRYAHITFEIGNNEETKFELNQADFISVKTNYNDVCKLDVDYIVSSNGDMDKYNEVNNYVDKIYSLDDAYVYKLNCLNS